VIGVDAHAHAQGKSEVSTIGVAHEENNVSYNIPTKRKKEGGDG